MRKSHGVVEELLELFIDKVDADLFKRIEFEDLKASDVQHADESDFFHCWIAGKKSLDKRTRQH